jgi:O-antigen ligase
MPVIYGVVKKVQSVKTDDYTRIWIWQDALRVWSKERILGVGPGNFWAYDQVFTNLPRGLRDFNVTGLGVAHNGYLQILGELGPIGEFFWLSFIVVVIVMAVRLFRRSKLEKRKGAGAFLDFIGLPLFSNVEKRDDRVLALVCLGLIAGSAVADTFAGGFFLPPRQVAILAELSQVITSWVVWGFVMYKDQMWRMTQRGVNLNKDERL